MSVNYLSRGILVLTVLVAGGAWAHGRDLIWFENFAAPIADASIQLKMGAIASEDIGYCHDDEEFAKERGAFFHSIPLAMSKGTQAVMLVVPGSSCVSVFHGAHSTAFWLLEEDDKGHVKLIFSGRRDGIALLDSYSEGYRDFELLYGFDVPVLVRHLKGAYREVK